MTLELYVDTIINLLYYAISLVILVTLLVLDQQARKRQAEVLAPMVRKLEFIRQQVTQLQESPLEDLGSVGYFWNTGAETYHIGLLESISHEGGSTAYVSLLHGAFDHFSALAGGVPDDLPRYREQHLGDPT